MRLPPSYVGVRRCRPSNKEVQSAWRTKNSDGVSISPAQQVTFTITDADGNERRMTTQEKKEAKRKIKAEQQEAKKKRKAECLAKNKVAEEAVSNNITDKNDIDPKEASNSGTNGDSEESVDPNHANNSNYHQLKVNSAAVEEELADLRGDRDGVPPVALMPCMALQAYKVGIITPESMPVYKLDDELAAAWASQLKESFKAAEEVRQQEDLRTMAYQLVPEVWKRMRPEALHQEKPLGVVDTETSSSVDKTQWSWLPIRHRVSPLDSDKAIVCALLYSRSKDLHISCGSKFGCDLLLYDGPREERHAFAGLRILGGGVSVGESSTIPRPYDLHGYVRCLNTAGKLSLLAKVDRSGDDGCARVAFVDLALEKILSAPRHAKRSVKKARRDVSKNLAKK